jgi:hypothetical protein
MGVFCFVVLLFRSEAQRSAEATAARPVGRAYRVEPSDAARSYQSPVSQAVRQSGSVSQSASQRASQSVRQRIRPRVCPPVCPSVRPSVFVSRCRACVRVVVSSRETTTAAVYPVLRGEGGVGVGWGGRGEDY